MSQPSTVAARLKRIEETLAAGSVELTLAEIVLAAMSGSPIVPKARYQQRQSVAELIMSAGKAGEAAEP